jgi:hypothetical protein
MRAVVTSILTALGLTAGVAVAWADTTPDATQPTVSLVATPTDSTAVIGTPVEVTPTLPTVETVVVQAAVTAAARVSTQVSAKTLMQRRIAMAKKPWGARVVAKAIAKNKHKWGATQFVCLNKLWTAESGWRYRASNSSSGAYGIPQAHPGSKMASVARDWRTNPVTQIRWGLRYIDSRYNTPCTAWSKFKRSHWY